MDFYETQEIRRYYGHLDKNESDQEYLILEFHCLEQNFVKSLLNSDEDMESAIFNSLDRVIAVNIKRKMIPVGLDNLLLAEESQWLILTSNKTQGIPALLFTEGNNSDNALPIPEEIFIDVNAVDTQTLDFLSEKLSMDNLEAASAEEILHKFDLPLKADFIAVYNVGQGNSAAICDYRGIPLLYFDLGGGCYANAKTYPKCLKFCMTHQPGIILSHWDTDHYQSAKMDPAYTDRHWLVPVQKIGPVHFKFLTQLKNKGNLLIWPGSLPEIIFSWGRLMLCNGPEGMKNHTGLAMETDFRNTSNPFKKVLLPADAAYSYVYRSSLQFVDALVVTHHGAEFDHRNSPIVGVRNVPAVVYSYGLNNTYGHPKGPAQNAHQLAGWSTERHTHMGHIMISNIHISPAPCGARCELQISQNF